jgi:hypothetical protein
MLSLLLRLEHRYQLGNEVEVFQMKVDSFPHLFKNRLSLNILKDIVVRASFPRKAVEISIDWTSQSG